MSVTSTVTLIQPQSQRPKTLSTISLPVVELPSGPVDAKLSFFIPPADGSTPYNYVVEQKDVPRTNYSHEERLVHIRDMRDALDLSHFDIEKFGFTAVETGSASPGVDFEDDESVRTLYYPEVEALLRRQIPSAHKVVIFDHTRRRGGTDRVPLLRAHIDQSARAAAWRVPLHIEDAEEAARLMAGRFRIVNVWRPINGTVETLPIALADSRTMPDAKLSPVEHRFPDRIGETLTVSYHQPAEWYYLSAMRSDERLLFQCYDSAGPRVPHTAFVDPRSTEASKPRVSLEVRALVFG